MNVVAYTGSKKGDAKTRTETEKMEQTVPKGEKMMEQVVGCSMDCGKNDEASRRLLHGWWLKWRLKKGKEVQARKSRVSRGG